MPLPLASYLRENPLAVTGLGWCGATGIDVTESWAALLLAEIPATVREISDGGRVLRLPVCAAPPDWESRMTGEGWWRRLDRSVQFARLAASEAWQDAGAALAGWTPERIGVITGTSRGAITTTTAALAALPRKGTRPTSAPGGAIACLSGALSTSLGLRGPAFTVSASCASGAAAIALAAQQILVGAADCVLVGAAEAPLTDLVLAQLRCAGALATGPTPQGACRPFDLTREGTVLGEGAAFLTLEPLESALRRGARVHARLAGWALGSEGGTRTGLETGGAPLARIMRQALTLGGIAPTEVGYVNLHGTGTRINDLAEAHALRTVFPHNFDALPCSSTKPFTGHCMGASAAIEAVISILTLRDSILPITANCRTPDPEAPAGLIRDAPQSRAVRAVMSNSSGFWGTHSSLLFTAPDGA